METRRAVNESRPGGGPETAHLDGKELSSGVALFALSKMSPRC